MNVLKTPFFRVLLGGLCFYAALPPLGWFPLVFLVPVFWTSVIVQPQRIRKRYVYLTGVLFWLASIWWIACPHPLTSLGLLALAGFLSFYWVLFFVAAHTAVHRWHISAIIAVPLCWVGCEYMRCHILGGFSFCALEHSLYKVSVLIQFAAVGGQYIVGGLIMLYGTMVVIVWQRQAPLPLWTLRLLTVLIMPPLLVVPLGWVVSIESINSNSTVVEVAALQGNIPVSLNPEPEHSEKTFRQFVDLTYQVVHDGRSYKKLIIYPETVCPISVLEFTGSVKPADVNLSPEEATEGLTQLQQFVDKIQVPVIFGLSTFSFDNDVEPRRLNSALLMKPMNNNGTSTAADVTTRYDKNHLVMFGEYIPFSEYLPDNFFLKSLCQEAGRGTKPIALRIDDDLTASVNICFESTVPHLIRRQVLSLRKQGYVPNLLINMSNDGWFRFSQQIDQHLATHVFRAVENRMWYVTATNGGYSAMISPTGKIVKIGSRGTAEAVTEVLVLPTIKPNLTVFQCCGDWYALVFAVITVVFLFNRAGAKKNA